VLVRFSRFCKSRILLDQLSRGNMLLIISQSNIRDKPFPFRNNFLHVKTPQTVMILYEYKKSVEYLGNSFGY